MQVIAKSQFLLHKKIGGGIKRFFVQKLLRENPNELQINFQWPNKY
jgi:hypothetical protein